MSAFQVKPFAIPMTAVWTTDQDQAIQFFAAYDGDDFDSGGFSVLCDAANVVGNDMVPQGGYVTGYAPDPGNPWVLARPVDFTWILDDKGSGNPVDLSYWWPVPPADYVAIGLCFGWNKPNPANYWCVHQSFCSPSANVQNFWSDAGQGWKYHSGDMVMVDADPRWASHFAPPALLSVEGMGNGLGAAMVIENSEWVVPEPH